MDLVDEEDTRDDLSTTFFAPFSYLLVYLLSHLRLDLTNITSKQSEESLSSAVNNVDFMKGHSVNDFLALLKFTFRALDKASLGTDVVVITAASE